MESPQRQILGGKKVLIVEDDFFEADDMRDAVESVGGTVVGPALEVDTALGLIEGDRPDVALLDVLLFRMSAVSIAERLTQLHVPFVVVTAYPRERLPPPLDTGPYVSKPYWREQLTDALGRAIASESDYSKEHHSLCPVCGTWVDELDLEEVLKHIDPDHKGPVKN